MKREPLTLIAVFVLLTTVRRVRTVVELVYDAVAVSIRQTTEVFAVAHIVGRTKRPVLYVEKYLEKLLEISLWE